MRAGDSVVTTPVFWALLYLVCAAVVPEVSELAVAGRSDLSYRAHNFELSWGLFHILPSLIGICLGLVLMKRSPVIAGIGIVVLTLEILYAILDLRRTGFLGDGTGRISLAAYAIAMLAAAVPFLAGWLWCSRRRIDGLE